MTPSAKTDRLRRTLRWLRRFRKRRGYGIHSPYAFAFVTGVVYERDEYYAYKGLERHFRRHAPGGLRLKDVRLLFRLANFQGAAACLVLGAAASSMEAAALRAADSRTRLTFLTSATAQSGLEAGGAHDMVYAAADWAAAADSLYTALADGGMLVLRGIHAGKESCAAWERLSALPRSTLCFDLHDFGVILHRPKLQRQCYTVNYF